MFQTVICLAIASRSSDGLTKVSGAPDRIDSADAVLTSDEVASRSGQPIITFDGGDKAMYGSSFITDCNTASGF